MEQLWSRIAFLAVLICGGIFQSKPAKKILPLRGEGSSPAHAPSGRPLGLFRYSKNRDVQSIIDTNPEYAITVTRPILASRTKHERVTSSAYLAVHYYLSPRVILPKHSALQTISAALRQAGLRFEGSSRIGKSNA